MRSMTRVTAILALITTAAVTAACSGCQHAPPNPVATADRPETVALALWGGFVIAEEAAATLAEHPATPKAVQQALVIADEKATPILKLGRPMAEEVERIRADIEAGGDSKPEQLAAAAANLNKWITDAAPLIKALQDELTKAKAAKNPGVPQL